jgi:2-polyprenyl-6-methoxyphenol hydroxylase-like FAD-dependent oxidoreductase
MQFHLNGFRPGDPNVSEADVRHQARRAEDRLPTQVDVLIVGCGPAGLTLAAQLAAFPGITTRVVEQKSSRLLVGQADGIACRTMEMFQAYGFADRVMKEAYWVNEFAFWKPEETHPETLVRSNRIQDVEDGLSEFPHVVLNQARVHDFYLEVMHNSPTRLTPDYNRRLLDVTIPKDAPDAPVSVRLERLDPEHQGEVETVSARFVVGCDGARSAVRRSLGRALHGDSANQAWGVMDVLAVTDFPDVRLKAAIQSAHDGSALIIPRGRIPVPHLCRA